MSNEYSTHILFAEMPAPLCTEEGYVIPSHMVEKFNFHTFNHSSVEFGSGQFPLNLYGDDTSHKNFPELGAC